MKLSIICTIAMLCSAVPIAYETPDLVKRDDGDQLRHHPGHYGRRVPHYNGWNGRFRLPFYPQRFYPKRHYGSYPGRHVPNLGFNYQTESEQPAKAPVKISKRSLVKREVGQDSDSWYHGWGHHFPIPGFPFHMSSYMKEQEAADQS